MKYDTDLDLKTNLKKLLGCYSTHHIFVATRNLITERDNLRESYNSSGKKRRALRDKFETLETQHNELLSTIDGLKQLVELPESAGLTELFETLDTVKYERDLYRDDANTQIGEITEMLVEAGLMRRNVNSSIDELIKDRLAAQSQLNEIKYIVHGDIQPCTVLYSDGTTTLLRLDENDMMLETETIEWSDVTTYRCQELLRGGAAPLRVIRHMAQLVRDGRISLNDDALEASGTGQPVVQARKPDESAETVEVHTIGEKEPRRVPPYHGTSVTSCEVCTNVYDSTLDLCPQCHTPKGLVSLDDTDEETGEAAEQKRIVDWAQDNPSVQLRPKCHTPKER